MRKQQLQQVWQKLNGKRVPPRPVLRRIRIDQLRGIRDLTVELDFPVCVLAGENGCGKSTVLFAAACAYKPVEGNGAPVYTPNSLFQRYEPSTGEMRDNPERSMFSADIGVDEGEVEVNWNLRNTRWRRTVRMIGKAESLPEHQCFLRTMTTHVDSQRAVRALGGTRRKPSIQQTTFDSAQVAFARQIMPHISHQDVVRLSQAKHSLLFTTREDAAKYSEVQMAGGERAVLRLAMEVSQLHNALVLIDEVEAGLHPQAQELLMLSLQQLALRNNLQVIVSTHSPVVLDCVPPSGRLFLERTAEKCTCVAPYPDLVQQTLYGRPLRGFNLLCEDKISEALLTGVLHFLVPRERWPLGSIQVVRNTGAAEFPTHAKAFEKCGILENFAFVLDGDQEGTAVEKKLRQATTQSVIFLPGQAPEEWIWDKLQRNPERYATLFGINLQEYEAKFAEVRAAFSNTGDTPAEKCKHMLPSFADDILWPVVDVCRIVGREECEHVSGGIRQVVCRVREAFVAWREAQVDWDD